MQDDENLKNVLMALREIELGHANTMLELLKKEQSNYQMPQPSSRARLQLWLGKYFGYDSFKPTQLSIIESKLSG